MYNRGIISLSWMMKNGKRVGGITEYKNGKALYRENWNSIIPYLEEMINEQLEM